MGHVPPVHCSIHSPSICPQSDFLSRRHADKTATLWLQRLKDSSSNKRLNLIYLANEVAQQSKARRKDDFLVAFAPIIAEATAIAYRGATNEVQQKLRRVVQVWRARQIFETPIQDAVEARIDGKLLFSSFSLKPFCQTPHECPLLIITILTITTQTSTNPAPPPRSPP